MDERIMGKTADFTSANQTITDNMWCEQLWQGAQAPGQDLISRLCDKRGRDVTIGSFHYGSNWWCALAAWPWDIPLAEWLEIKPHPGPWCAPCHQTKRWFKKLAVHKDLFKNTLLLSSVEKKVWKVAHPKERTADLRKKVQWKKLI